VLILLCGGAALASNKEPCGCSIAPPPLGGVRRRGSKMQNSWVGRRTVAQSSKGSEQ